MKYFILLAGNGELTAWEDQTPEQQQAEMEKHGEFAGACEAKDGVTMLGGEALEAGDTATTLRTRGGKTTITDGPFVEAAEHIGGYYLVEAPDLDAVIELCDFLPRYDIEIRPVIDV